MTAAQFSVLAMPVFLLRIATEFTIGWRRGRNTCRLAGADVLMDASALRRQALRVACDAHLASVVGVACRPKAALAAQGNR